MLNTVRSKKKGNVFINILLYEPLRRYVAVCKLVEPNLSLRDSLISDNVNRLLTLKVWLIMVKSKLKV